ncbi:MAG: helix-turn-helix domain-containing protein [Thermoleophilia bacterium]
MTPTQADSIFEQIRTGLQDSIAYSRRELTLATTTLPSPPPPMCAGDIAALRRVLHMSQAVFAATLNVSVKTIQSWEQGRRVPSDVALRFLQLIAEDPRVVDRLFREGSAQDEARHRGVPRSSQHRP